MKRWHDHSGAISSKHPPSHVSTSIMLSTILYGRSDATTRRCRVTQQEVAAHPETVDHLANWRSARLRKTEGAVEAVW